MDASAPVEQTKAFQKNLADLYGKTDVPAQTLRYKELAGKARTAFQGEPRFFSAPGRTELGGNHTDHNRGRVLCAAVTLDAVAAVLPTDGSEVELWSEGWERPFRVELTTLSPLSSESGTTEALIRGVAEGFVEAGYRIGGFKAVLDSRVLPGSGLSSSAALEVLLGAIFSGLYNDGGVRPSEIARIGQRAENKHFGKPCGLMDQTVSAEGGVLLIDFSELEAPRVKRLTSNLEKSGYGLVVVSTGTDHANHQDDYAAIPREMRAVASVFGKETLRGLEISQFLRKLPEVRTAAGDRAALRALHFLEENDRVLSMAKALEDERMKRYIKLVKRSGSSSWRYLQNVLTPGDTRTQSLGLALALTESFLGKRGACRVHGGGFGGTMQAYIPLDALKAYKEYMGRCFGRNCVTRLRIRAGGACEVTGDSA